MFSVSPIEPIVSLDDASVSQTDYQCASAEVCVIEDAAPVNATPVQDDTLTGEKITTSSVADRDAMFGTLGATELLSEGRSLNYKIDMFDSLVDRFSTSATVREKVAVVKSIFWLVASDQYYHSSANDEFIKHVQEFGEDAVQSGGRNMEILMFMHGVFNNMDRHY
jgi:hypothetical protein